MRLSYLSGRSASRVSWQVWPASARHLYLFDRGPVTLRHFSCSGVQYMRHAERQNIESLADLISMAQASFSAHRLHPAYICIQKAEIKLHTLNKQQACTAHVMLNIYFTNASVTRSLASTTIHVRATFCHIGAKM